MINILWKNNFTDLASCLTEDIIVENLPVIGRLSEKSLTPAILAIVKIMSFGSMIFDSGYLFQLGLNIRIQSWKIK